VYELKRSAKVSARAPKQSVKIENYSSMHALGRRQFAGKEISSTKERRNMTWILVRYDSLPDMPSKCRIFSPSLVHRDFFECNPANTGQKSLPRFELMTCESGSHKSQLRKLLRQPTVEKYVVFYTRHTRLKGEWKNKIVGYFKVHPETRGNGGFRACEVVLLPKTKCAELPRSVRGAAVSWGRSKVKARVERFVRRCAGRKADDMSELYQRESSIIAAAFSHRSGQRWFVRTCSSCPRGAACHWGRKADKGETLQRLYGAVEE
jgi:hypothetical protein